MHVRRGIGHVVFAVIAVLGVAAAAQTSGEREEFTAIGIANNDLGSGAGQIIIRVNRWSTEAEREQFVTTLRQKGQQALLEELRRARSTGTIRTPDSLAYDLRYAHQEKGEDGGRRIVLVTDRPIGFYEAANQPRTIQYPFTVVQMQFPREGKGKGTIAPAAKIIPAGKAIVIENYATSPVMLTEIEARVLR